nr:unnamed protein product [Callosobruchus analis]
MRSMQLRKVITIQNPSWKYGTRKPN